MVPVIAATHLPFTKLDSIGWHCLVELLSKIATVVGGGEVRDLHEHITLFQQMGSNRVDAVYMRSFPEITVTKSVESGDWNQLPILKGEYITPLAKLGVQPAAEYAEKKLKAGHRALWFVRVTGAGFDLGEVAEHILSRENDIRAQGNYTYQGEKYTGDDTWVSLKASAKEIREAIKSFGVGMAFVVVNQATPNRPKDVMGLLEPYSTGKPKLWDTKDFGELIKALDEKNGVVKAPKLNYDPVKAWTRRDIVMIGTPPKGWTTTKFAQYLRSVSARVEAKFTKNTTAAFYAPELVNSSKLQLAAKAGVKMYPYEEVVQVLLSNPAFR